MGENCDFGSFDCVVVVVDVTCFHLEHSCRIDRGVLARVHANVGERELKIFKSVCDSYFVVSCAIVSSVLLVGFAHKGVGQVSIKHNFFVACLCSCSWFLVLFSFSGVVLGF